MRHHRPLKQLNPGIAIAVVIAAGFAFPIYSCARHLDLDESLYGAALRGDIPEMRRLIDHGADVNALFDGTQSVLGAAVQANNPEAVRLLLDHHADPSIEDGFQHKTATRLSKPYPKNPSDAAQSRRTRLTRPKMRKRFPVPSPPHGHVRKPQSK